MKTKLKQRSFLAFGIIAMLLLAILAVPFNKTEANASSPDPDLSMFSFTKVGTTHYSVELIDSSVKYAKIPDAYEGLPVKEIGGSGFAMHSQLEEVDIPERSLFWL